MVITYHDFIVLMNHAALNPPDGNSAHKLVIVDGGNQHLERLVHIRLRRRDIVQNGVKQGLEIGASHIRRIGCSALTSGAEQHGALQLIVGGVQVDEQLQYLVHNLQHALVRTVNLVDNYDHAMTQLQCLGQHKTGLGHGTLCRVYQQDNAVDHLEDTLYLAAEVRMPGGVNNVDLRVLIGDGSVLCQNGDAALPLQIVGVHNAVHNLLVFPIDAALLEHLVHQGGFTVVNVGNDGYVSDFLVYQSWVTPFVKASFPLNFLNHNYLFYHSVKTKASRNPFTAEENMEKNSGKCPGNMVQ